ncbi:MAG TPA: RNA 2',3'-cyclic phosphodiesterase [Chloroflexi bacterium]|nr:MAG: 2'-5' RNA ligase [Anaerolineaceae bacterium 4572_5.1]HEY84882.1 RNA 2',3'-cyclic phosphodiesterase [Chloroflexota bacterium]
MATNNPTHYRLFIAIDLPPEARQSLARVQDKLKSVRAIRWAKPQQIHLTLQFLGDTPIARVEAISDALQLEVSSLSSLGLTLNGVGVFPNPKRPRIIWAGLGGEGDALKALHRAVISATQTVGFQAEKRPFKPHLTIGRVQKWAKSSDYAAIRQVIQRNPIAEIATFSVDHISLIRSQLKPTGPIYTQLARVDLEN